MTDSEDKFLGFASSDHDTSEDKVIEYVYLDLSIERNAVIVYSEMFQWLILQ